MQTGTRQPNQCPWNPIATVVGSGLLLLVLSSCMLLSGTRTPATEDAETAADTQAGQAEVTQPADHPNATALPPTEGLATVMPPPQASATPSHPTNTPAPACTDVVVLVYDVTVPDNTRMPPDRSFAKAWRLQNSGTCTWTRGYALVFDSGARMGGPATQNLTEEVLPGTTIDLSVILTTPSSPGTYRGEWKLQNELGVAFGLAGGEPFHVQLVVSP